MSKMFVPADLSRIHYLSWPVVSQDGTRVACVEKVGDAESGLFVPGIRVMLRENGDIAYRTPDGHGEKQPVFLPEGRLLYLSDESGEYQIWLRDLATDEACQLTTLRHGVNHFSASADGGRIVFEATLWPEETEQGLAFAEMSAAEKAAWRETLDWTPYEATDLVYKMDEWYGMRKGEYAHIGTCLGDGGAQRILDANGMECVFPAISSDGACLAFFGLPYGGARGYVKELFACDFDGANCRQISEKTMLSADQPPVFLDDGEAVACAGYHKFGDGFSTVPLRLPLVGGETEALADVSEETICEGMNELVVGRAENGENCSSLWQAGEWLYFLGGFKGRTNVYRVLLGDAKAIEIAHAGDGDVQAFGMNAKGDMAILQGTWREPAELFMDGRRFTDANAWLRDFPQGHLEERRVRSKDGQVELHYFLLHPVDEEPGRHYPAVLDIKGGPQTMYGATWWHEFHVLSAAGFAVIYGNPRGSAGFGRAFMADGVCWKQEVIDDLLAMCEDAAATGLVDMKRLGVTGGSYGGYMTVKMLGLTDVFAAAVVQRALVNTATSYGTGDIGFVSARGVPANFSMLAYLEDRARGNNLSRVDSINAPTLILHAYKDFRCTFEQAEQLFVAMKERRPQVPVRLVMFPGENHALTRTGRMHHQIRHLQEMVDWFTKYLKEATQHE